MVQYIHIPVLRVFAQFLFLIRLPYHPQCIISIIAVITIMLLFFLFTSFFYLNPFYNCTIRLHKGMVQYIHIPVSRVFTQFSFFMLIRLPCHPQCIISIIAMMINFFFYIIHLLLNISLSLQLTFT